MLTAVFLITFICLSTSFFCSLVEASLYSISAGRVEELKKAGSRNGIRLHQLRQRIDEPIAAILTLNTIANSMGPALAGSLIGRYFAQNPDLATLIYSIILTIIILIFAEIIPKTLGVTFADRVAPVVSGPVLVVIFVTKPLVFLSSIVTRFLKRKTQEESAPTENEILAMAEMAVKAGKLRKDEGKWLTNALLLNDVTAKDLMTPRTVVYMLPADLPLSQVQSQSDHWSHSRLPVVHNNNPDKVEGIIYRRTIFDYIVNEGKENLENKTLRDLMRPAQFVPETIPASDLLNKFIESQEHLLVVTNEFGGMEGVISLEDVLEFILGVEIVDPYDKFPDMQAHARVMAQRKERRNQLADLVDDRISSSKK